METKRKGDIVGSLVEDANRRKNVGKRIRGAMSNHNQADGDKVVVKNFSSSKIASPIVKNAPGNSSSDLLLKRFNNDLRQVLLQFECNLDTRISEVTM